MASFRLTDGVEASRGDSGGFELKVSMPTDEDEFFGRECPSCKQHFRIEADGYQSFPDNQSVWCVYCGHNDEIGAFITAQQLERAESPAWDFAVQLVRDRLGSILQDACGRPSRQPGDSFIQVSYRTESRPFYPRPLPGISEERLIRERVCGACGLRYAVFGEHRFCPVCGRFPALTTALDALSDVPPASRDHLRESGVLDRTYADTIKNVVGIVEAMAKRVFFEHVTDAGLVPRPRGQAFQRLDDLADLFGQHLGVDVRRGLGSVWTELQETWAARHVFTHSDGIVDAKYLAAVPRNQLREGQRLTIIEHQAREAVDNAERLCAPPGDPPKTVTLTIPVKGSGCYRQVPANPGGWFTPYARKGPTGSGAPSALPPSISPLAATDKRKSAASDLHRCNFRRGINLAATINRFEDRVETLPGGRQNGTPTAKANTRGLRSPPTSTAPDPWKTATALLEVARAGGTPSSIAERVRALVATLDAGDHDVTIRWSTEARADRSPMRPGAGRCRTRSGERERRQTPRLCCRRRYAARGGPGAVRKGRQVSDSPRGSGGPTRRLDRPHGRSRGTCRGVPGRCR